MNAHSIALQIGMLLLDWAVRAAFLAAVAGLIVAIVRIRDIRTRLALWSALLFGSFLLPVLRPLMPPLLPSYSRVAAAPRPVTRPSLAPVRMRAAAAPARIAAAERSYFPEIGLGLWFAGALVLLTRLLIGTILARRVIRTALPVADRIRPMRGLRVFESARVSVPLTARVFRPVVLLPENWREWDSERLRAVLAHERSHVERYDGLVRVAAQLHRAVLWFSPVAWWLERHLADLAECASDDSALAETMDRSAYAAIVLDFFRAGTRRLSIEGLAMAQGGPAERRIDRILAGGPLRAHLRRTTLVAVLALTGGSVVLVAALQNRPAAPAPPPAAPTAPQTPIAPSAPTAPTIHAPSPPAAPEPPAAPQEPDAWVIFHGDSPLTMGLHDHADLDMAQAMHDRAKQDMIWIRRGSKAWVIDDAAVLREVGELLRPVEALSNQDEAFNRQREALERAREEMSQAMEKMRGSMPHLDENLKKLEEQLRLREPTAEQLSQLQEKLAEMESRLAEARQAMGGREELARKMDELARKRDQIRRLQEVLGEDQDRAGENAGQVLEKLLDDAIRRGLARPCEPVH
jgi:beta-lactamase regulating signal transducer with metallopeptidase domain